MPSFFPAGIVALIHAYDPEVVVVGGAIAKQVGLFLDYIQSYVDLHAWAPWGRITIKVSHFGANAALVGATPLFAMSE